MILRLLLLLVLPVIAYYVVMAVTQRFKLTSRQNRIMLFITAAFLVIGALIVMGRLPVQFILAPIGAAATFMLRMLPTLLRLLPMWQILKSRVASARPRESGQSSTIRTKFLEMELQHGSGDMDGKILQGIQAQKKLSTLSLNQLLDLSEECSGDHDSSQVLEAYIDRMHPNWREHTGKKFGKSGNADESVMTKELAIEILGLDAAPNRNQIIKAYRSLMQKLHPDRGGSDYLAKKINAAKDFLLTLL
ncbi:MAG TPA: molecular chaperone DnaJ [Gammaproteobacteria bacterium]|nr:molecular chaperone DnaJ [Gammaproteobacteria bacterium]HAT28721.1 molecular chaperone DnaJ [Gammaproteobacteria bacterium]|tara:strand:- start:1807 stop:2550 length:744 start_codon:yes stop_codon:yes gene_type:complete